MMIWIVLLAASTDAVTYEADTHPSEAGWEVFQEVCDPVLYVDNSTYVIDVDLCPGYDPPGGQQADYVRNLDDFQDATTFFLDFRVYSSALDTEFPWGGGGIIGLGGNLGVDYFFQIVESSAEFTQDFLIPPDYVPLTPELHRYRLEIYDDDLFVLYVDGVKIKEGLPEGPFPNTLNPIITWRGKAAFDPSVNIWDYVRYGLVQDEGSGDYDSSRTVDLFDWYYVLDCMTLDGPGIYGGPSAPCPEDDDTCEAIGETTTAGPGCTFADFDEDADVDVRDVAIFLAAFNPAE